ncbi:MAG: gliding motility-associated C-terminal domain-containing protein [Chitinophagia bacterium]|nr:gliding motility-associated C-terminal domain-containing protein [Chitinophagia bacterium]
MKRLLHTLIMVLCTSISVHAQYNAPENRNWTFGNRAGVRFAPGSTSTFTSSISTSEGCASVSDAAGNLLFYTDGRKVWDRSHAVMPSGSSIASFTTSSSSQGALIVPVVGSSTQYYVFSLENVGFSGGGFCHLVYCRVDMSLAGGMGDVVSSTIGTALNSDLGEKMCAIAGSSCNVWVMVHHIDSNIFFAYNITSAGLSTTPVRSIIGSFTSSSSRGYGAYGIGVMKGSPDRSKIVTQTYNPSAGYKGTQLFDFDPATGIVSNCRVLDSTSDCYGADFSPNSRYLYSDEAAGSARIIQYDVSGSTAAAIRATRYTVATGSGYPQINLAPDSTIYMIGISGTGFLDRIRNPDVGGSGCNFVSHAITLASGTNGIFGLPNMVVKVLPSDTTFYRHDTVACVPIRGSINISSHLFDSAYTWFDGGYTTRTRSITAAGTYICMSSSGCSSNIDSIVVSPNIPTLATVRHDSVICLFTGPITLPARSGYPFRVWDNGTSGTTRGITGTGVYYCRVYDSCLNAVVDTFNVIYLSPDTTINRSHDSSVCITRGSLVLNAPPYAYTRYSWSNGGTGASTVVTTSGTYFVRSTIGCHVDVDTFHVTFIPQPVVNLGNDTAFCIGSSITLRARQPAGYSLLWNTGASTDSLWVGASDTYWLRVSNGCVVTDTIHVLVSPFPVVDLGSDSFNCDGRAYTLQSSVPYTSPTYLWNTGASTPSITVTATGTYWVRVSVAGCASADTTHVTIIYDTINLINRDTTVCKGSVLLLAAYINPVATCQWLPTAGIRNSTYAVTSIRPDTSATYVLHVYITGCPEISDSFRLNVDPLPNVVLGGNRRTCEFDTLHLRPYVTPSWYSRYRYDWTPGTYLDDSTVANVIYTPGLTTKYILKVSTDAGCVGYDSLVVNAGRGNFSNPIPDVSVCPHDSVKLTASGGSTYRWLPNRYVDDSTAASPWIRAITTTRYMVIATSTEGCTDTQTVKVTVYPAAVVSIPDTVHLYAGESYSINTVSNCSYFTWFPAVGLDNPTAPNPTLLPVTIGGTYTVTATTDKGCKAVDSIAFIVDPHALFTVPNAFTPGNIINNRFKLLRRGDGVLQHFRIFNRWGNVVFETQNIDEGWDGMYNGEPQPFGVYIYEISANSKDGTPFKKRGNVTLIR